jgi:hypothetical protein
VIPWNLVVYGLIALGVGGYVLHCEHVKKELAQSIAVAEEQIRENERQAARDKKLKEQSDENYKKRIARVNADLKRLRESGAGFLSTPAAGSADASRTTYDRADVDAALRAYRAEIIELLGEGQKAVEGLDEGRVWARSIMP